MSIISIQRAPHGPGHQYVKVSRAQVLSLPPGTLGVLVKLLAFGDGWEISPQRLDREFNLPEGQWKSAKKDLKARGFLDDNEQLKDDKSKRITGRVWRLQETPQNHVANSHRVENHPDGNQQVESHDMESHPAGDDPDLRDARESRNLESRNQKDSGINQEQELSSTRATSGSEALHRYLLDFVSTLGEPEPVEALNAEIERLGDAEARDVLLGCGKAGSWQYVLTALQRRATPPTSKTPPGSAPPPVTAFVPPARLHRLGHLEGLWLTLCSGDALPPRFKHALTFGATITEGEDWLRVEPANTTDGDYITDPAVQKAVAEMVALGGLKRFDLVPPPVFDELPTASPDDDDVKAGAA